MSQVTVTYCPAFNDIYIWFIHGLPEKHAQNKIIIVDPGDAAPVIEAINAHQYEPVAIFITHHHADHVGGVAQLLARYDIAVYGPAHENISSISHHLTQDDIISLPSMGLTFSVLDVPGHTRGHIAYFGHELLFIGDTLFAGGCGRLFEGTAEQMHDSLSKLLQLDDNTMVYCAHEYTQDNLVFAERVEPENTHLQERIKLTDTLRQNHQPTVPSRLKIEKQTNPFLRFNEQTVKLAAEDFAQQTLNTPAEIFKTVRYWKDTLD